MRIHGAGAAVIIGALGIAGSPPVAAAEMVASDVAVARGRVAAVDVHGEVFNESTFGVNVLVELVPRAGATGSVVFTPALPVDVEQLSDPWPGAGTFSPFDTDRTASSTLNGSVDDNGSFLPANVTFSGPLSRFPVRASADAFGAWEVRLATSAGSSSWEGIETQLRSGMLRIVEFGDGNGNAAIDTRDYSELQVCFTGPAGPVEPPAYSLAPERRCGVYDFDGDGDVDGEDYAAFWRVFSGPGS